MENLHFTIQINAPVEKVWNTMLEDATYREWTAVMNPGSHYIGDWETGSTILFAGPDYEKEAQGGLAAVIKENRRYEVISIEYTGLLVYGEVDSTSEMAKEWIGDLEKYTFIKNDNRTEVQVDLELREDQIDMFKDMWPKSLEKLKEISEL